VAVKASDILAHRVVERNTKNGKKDVHTFKFYAPITGADTDLKIIELGLWDDSANDLGLFLLSRFQNDFKKSNDDFLVYHIEMGQNYWYIKPRDDYTTNASMKMALSPSVTKPYNNAYMPKIIELEMDTTQYVFSLDKSGVDNGDLSNPIRPPREWCFGAAVEKLTEDSPVKLSPFKKQRSI
jgi:hypothetical protein